MAWIKTIPISQADEKLQRLLAAQRDLYPAEYEAPVPSLADPAGRELSGIASSHTLLPETLYHAFATFGTLMAPELPLQRYQHEMIATMVSVTNRCHY